MTNLELETNLSNVDPAEPDTPLPAAPDGDDEPVVRKSQASRLVELAGEQYDLGVSTTGEPFAIEKAGPNLAKVFRGGNSSFGKALAEAFHRSTGSTPTAQARADALAVLDSRAGNEDPTELHLRVASDDDTGRILVDLGRPDGWAVEIRKGSWQLVDRSPVIFRRTGLTQPLPLPAERGGDIDALAGLLNVNADDWPLVVAWLVAALFEDIAHPALFLAGEQGTGKSTAAKMLGRIIDPTGVPLRSAPRTEDAWQTAALGSWVVPLDNLSRIEGWLSDALCRSVTGDGAVRRQLYTDSDLFVVQFRRCVIMTTIDVGHLRGDLAERLLPVELERIDRQARVTDDDLEKRFQAIWPTVLGGLFDLAADVLDVLPTVELDELPRMADFARIVAAIDVVRGTDMCAAYIDRGDQLAADLVESDDVAAAIVRLVDEHGTWEGTSQDLLQALTPDNPNRYWPTNANQIPGRIKRAATSLLAVGVDARRGEGRRYKTWTITRQPEKVGEKPSQPSQPSRAARNKAITRHGSPPEAVTAPSPPSPWPPPRDGSTPIGDGSNTEPSRPQPRNTGAGNGRDGCDGSAPTNSGGPPGPPGGDGRDGTQQPISPVTLCGNGCGRPVLPSPQALEAGWTTYCTDCSAAAIA